jgi:hypothetical protein
MFSEMIDDLMLRVSRADASSRANMVAYANATVRELQQTVKCFRDRVEDLVSLAGNGSNNSFVWDRPNNFRTIFAVRYMPDDVYAKLRPPGPLQADWPFYYYGGPTYLTFVGVAVSTEIQLAYYVWMPRMIYYAVGARPAIFDRDLGTWSYRNDQGQYVSSLADPAQMEAAENRVGYWIILDHLETVQEGTLAKYFKTSDNERAAASFAVFREMKNKFSTDEVDESSIARSS